MIKRLIAVLAFTGAVLSAHAQAGPSPFNKALNNERCWQWVDSTFNKMSLKEKVGQLFIFTIAPLETKANLDLLDDVVKEYKVGGLLFSGGEMELQVKLTNRAQEMAEVPLMITFDGEWGLSMRLKGTPVFPRNMILGCIEDNRLIHEYGKEIARQCRELGVHVNFSPVADVNINPRNPVINTRSFGESPANVADKVIAYSTGLESGGVLSVSKHFPGHGDTDVDSHKALPVLLFDRARLDSVELYPFRQAIRADVGGIMVGHLEVPALEPEKGLPASLSANVIQKLLIKELGFKGLVFTDALAMKGVSSHPNVSLKALKAGNDIVLTPRQIKTELEAVVRAVKRGDISEAEIDRKCKKVLAWKYALGVHTQPPVRLSGLENRINTPQTRELIRKLNQSAVTVLQNRENLLPLHPEVGEVALVHVGLPPNAGGFEQAVKKYVTVNSFQLRKDMPAVERKSTRERLSRHNRVIICVTEKELAAYRVFLNELPPETPVVYVFLTAANRMSQIQQGIASASAVVMGHTTNPDTQEHIAHVIFGEGTATGRLSATTGSFAAGTGITLTPETPHFFLPEEFGLKSRILQKIDTIALEGITKGAYPGCQVLVMKEGKVMYEKSFGTFDGKKDNPVTPESIYDIASLSKTCGTLLAVMKLYDKGLFNLSDKLSDHLSFLKKTDKKDITIREILYHQSGLPSTISFYLRSIDKESYPGRLFKASKDKSYSVRIGSQTYAQPGFKFLPGMISPAKDDTHTLQINDNMWLNKAFSDSIIAGIKESPLKSKTYRYSCVGFVLLQKLAEKLSGQTLDEFLAEEFYRPMGLKRTAFLPLRYFGKEEIVPSSVDNFLRKTTVRGYVHDETAAYQGGVSGNAGLFSTARDIALIHQMLLNGGELDGERYLSKETCHLFTTSVSKISRRGLGFDKPDTKNPDRSPCSKSTPGATFGHTGFTGTAAWADPVNDIVYVFLSNRIYPDVWVNELSRLEIRQRVQEVVYEAMR